MSDPADRFEVGTGSGAWRAVAGSMAAGALWDLVFGIAILFFDDPAAKLLGLTLPDDRIYYHLCGLLLVLLAGMYALAALDPVRYQGVVAVAAAGRLSGLLFFALRVFPDGPAPFVVVAIVDGVLGLLHGTLLVLARRSGPGRKSSPAAGS